MSTTPVTFTHESFVIFDVEANCCCTTVDGWLAIFSTKKVADVYADRTRARFGRVYEVRPVFITPAGEVKS